jgi:endo-1,4-beta-xylanase
MRKFNIKIAVLLTLAGVMFSCAELDDDINSATDIDKPISVIVNEKISAYDELNICSGNIIMGADASTDDMDGSSAITTLLKTNFDQITPTSELYANAILSNDGEYDFSSINEFIESAKKLGLSVYGDAIVSNVNQNDTFLTATASSLTYLTPLYPNVIDQTVIEDGAFTDWAMTGDISIADYDGETSIKMVNGASVGASTAPSMQSPVFSVDSGANYELTFYVLATQVGAGRVTFTGLNDNEPAMDWTDTGVKTDSFITEIGWNVIQVSTNNFDDSGDFSFRIEMGYMSNVTYYMNVRGLSLINTNGSVDNPDEIFFEAEDAQQSGDYMLTIEDEDASGGKTLVGVIDGDYTADESNPVSPSTAADEIYQFTYTFNVNTAGLYFIWERQKAKVADNGYDSYFMSVDGAAYYCPGWPGWGDVSNTTSWTWMKLYTASETQFYLSEGEHTISIRIREGGHYHDRFYITLTTNEPSGFGSAAIAQEEVTLDVDDDVVKLAVAENLKVYVENVIDNLDSIKAWTVVKDPYAEDGSVAVSGGTEVAGEY